MSGDAVHQNLARVLTTNPKVLDSLIKAKLPSLLERLTNLHIWDKDLAKSLVPKVQSFLGNELHYKAVFYLASVMALSQGGDFQKELESALSIVTKENPRHRIKFYYDDAAIILAEQTGPAHQSLVTVINQELDAQPINWKKITELNPQHNLKVKSNPEDTKAFCKYILAVNYRNNDRNDDLKLAYFSHEIGSGFLFATLKFPEALEYFAKIMPPKIVWQYDFQNSCNTSLDYYLNGSTEVREGRFFNLTELLPIISAYSSQITPEARKVALQIICSLQTRFWHDEKKVLNFTNNLSQIARVLVGSSESPPESQILIRIAKDTLLPKDRFPLLLSLNNPITTLTMITNDPNYWKIEDRQIKFNSDQLDPFNVSILRLAFARSQATESDYQKVIQELGSTENSEVFETLIKLAVSPETSDQVGKILMKRRSHRRDQMAPHAFNLLPLTKSKWVLSALTKECEDRAAKIEELEKLKHSGHGLKIRETELRKVTDVADDLWRAIYPKGKVPDFIANL